MPETHLLPNLHALDRVDAPLAARIRDASAEAHLHPLPDGAPGYRLHGTVFPLEIPSEAVSDLAAQPPPGEVLLFGVGRGELLPALLGRPDIRVVAWDRDPALLRLSLSLWDLAEAILAGRLRLSLGVDLLETADPTRAVLPHPLLARIYEDERRTLTEAAQTGPWVVVAVGGLFVDDLSEGLRGRGHRVWPLDVRRLGVAEIEHTLRRLRPAALFSINHVHGLAEVCEAHGVPLVVWEIDPCTDRVRSPAAAVDHTSIYTWRRAHVDVYRAAGFPHVEHLPLAASPTRRRPLDLTPEERAHYAAPVGFVGSSMVAQARKLRRRFLDAFAAWHPSGAAALPAAEAALGAALAEQRRTPRRLRLEKLLAPHFGPFLADRRAEVDGEDPLLLVAESAASEKRLSILAGLGRFGAHVWGDGHWAGLASHGVVVRGPAGHREELTRIYNATRISVDINRIYQPDIVTMRVFDVLSSGGFVLAEWSEELEDLFEVGVEIDTWRTVGELHEKITHHLDHPEAARAMAARGRDAVLTRHSLDDRLGHLLSGLERRAPSGSGTPSLSAHFPADALQG